MVALLEAMKQNLEKSLFLGGNAHKSGRIDRHTEGTDVHLALCRCVRLPATSGGRGECG